MIRRHRSSHLSAALLAAAAALSACGERGQGGRDGHDHGAHGHGDHGEHGEGDEGHADEVTLTADAVAKGGVRVESAALRPLVPTYRAPARVALDLDATAHVGVPVRGRVRDLRVKRGDTVEKGAVLFVLDSPELGSAQNELLLRRVVAETVGPSVEIARSAYERARRLYDGGGNMTLTEVQRRESELRTAEAAATTARAAVTTSENTLRLIGMSDDAVERLAATKHIDTTVTVTAPIAGTVLAREVTLGELVSADAESLLVLGDSDVVWVFAHVPETRLAEVKAGAGVRLHVAALPGRVIEGRVAGVLPRLDEATRTAEVRVDVRDARGLRPGMYAQADVVMGDPAPPVLAIPEAAVQTVEGGPAVFVPVPNEANTFAKRAVRVGEAVGGFVPVIEGLAAGEPFVAAGSFILKAELGKSGAAHEH